MFFQIKQEDITKVEGEFDFLGSIGDTYFVKSEDRLQEPFVQIKKFPSFTLTEEQRQLLLQNKEKEVQTALCSFVSNALGELGIYDSDLVHQANLSQVLALGKGGKLRVKLESKEGKEYVFHTQEQVQQVMSDWVKYREEVLDSLESLKKGI